MHVRIVLSNSNLPKKTKKNLETHDHFLCKGMMGEAAQLGACKDSAWHKFD